MTLNKKSDKNLSTYNIMEKLTFKKMRLKVGAPPGPRFPLLRD